MPAAGIKETKQGAGASEAADDGTMARLRHLGCAGSAPAAPPRRPSDEYIPKVGGIDFGFRNPFAALWGFVDRDDVLWIVGEHYARQKPLSHHAQFLPHNVTWYGDPSGATEISELRCADFVMRAGNNALRPGIAALTARLESGKLRVLKDCCPNLLAEAGLYRWSGRGEVSDHAEAPLDEHNHALSALRYLISRLDARKMAQVA